MLVTVRLSWLNVSLLILIRIAISYGCFCTPLCPPLFIIKCDDKRSIVVSLKFK